MKSYGSGNQADAARTAAKALEADPNNKDLQAQLARREAALNQSRTDAGQREIS